MTALTESREKKIQMLKKLYCQAISVAMPVPHRSTDRTAAHPTHWLICAQVWTVDEGAALRALLSRGADEVSVVSNAPFALQKELAALRAAAGCPARIPRLVYHT